MLLDVVKHSGHVDPAGAAHHEVDNGEAVLVVILHELVTNVYVVGPEDVAQGLDVVEDAVYLDTDNLGFPQEIMTLLNALDVDKNKNDEQGSDDADEVHSRAYRQSDTCSHPDARRRGESTHRAFHLDDGAGTQETNTTDDLGGDAPWVTVLEAEIDLGNIDGYEHGQCGTHRDEGKGAQAGDLTLATPFDTDCCSQQHAKQQFGYRTSQIDVRADNLVIKVL